MKNTTLLLLLAMVFVLAAIGLSFSVVLQQAPTGPLPTTFTVANKTFYITAYAVTTAQQEKGLMNRTVSNNTFMLFVFNSTSQYSFWMKDTYTPLDMIWINSHNSTGTVVYIVNATPCSSYDPNQTACDIYTPASPANYVIETRSGFAQRYGLTVGEKIYFNFS